MALAGPIMGTPLLGGAEHPTRHNRQFQEHAGVRVGYRCSLLAAEEVLWNQNFLEYARDYLQLSLRHKPNLWSPLWLSRCRHDVPIEEIYVAENCPVLCALLAVCRNIQYKTAHSWEKASLRNTHVPTLIHPSGQEVSERTNQGNVWGLTD